MDKIVVNNGHSFCYIPKNVLKTSKFIPLRTVTRARARIREVSTAIRVNTAREWGWFENNPRVEYDACKKVADSRTGFLIHSKWNPFKREDPKQLVRRWQAALRKEVRGIDRQVLDLQREQRNAAKLIKDAARRGDIKSAKIIAKEVVTVRRTIGKLAMNKASMISLQTQLSEQLAMANVAGTLGKSSEVMKLVNNLTKLPQLQTTMREMAQEMYKAGVLEEMVSDTIDSAIDEEGLEDESEEAVDKILVEVAGETLAEMVAAPTTRRAAAATQVAQPTAEDEAEQEELAARLAAVRS